MAFTNVSTADSAPGKPVTSEWAEKMVKNDSFLNGQLGSLGTINILNGSFEVNDTSVTGGAADWSVTPYTGGSATVSTIAAHGAQSIKMTHPGGAGNGGAIAVSDFLPVSPGRDYIIKWAIRTTAALLNQIEVLQYSGGKVLNSTTFAYNSASSNADFNDTSYKFTPDSSGRFIKVRLSGGTTSATVGGDVYFDGIEIAQQVKQDFIKTATGQVASTLLSSANVFSVSMADFGFFPSVRVGVNATGARMTPVVGTTDNIGKFGLIVAPTGSSVSSAVVTYRYITNSEGFKGARFLTSSGGVGARYTLSDAPPNWETIFNSMAKDNGWTWEPTTERNT